MKPNIRAPLGSQAWPALLAWKGAANTVVEGNRFVNCQLGIALGAVERTPDDHAGGVIRNNIVYREAGEPLGGFGISVTDSPGTQVLHNTIVLSGTYEASIETRGRDTIGGLVANNLADAPTSQRDGVSVVEYGNDTSAFPAVFLDPVAVVMVPLPDAAVYWLELGSVLASAEAAALYFAIAGTPLMRDRTIFELPGITLQVAQECSGIRSSWVLFITGVLASRLFLRSPWRRIVLVAFVIPLGILRNGFRILVIGLLCVHVGPHMINSIIHHRGGPLFFALSLIPLLFPLWLRRGERNSAVPGGEVGTTPQVSILRRSTTHPAGLAPTTSRPPQS